MPLSRLAVPHTGSMSCLAGRDFPLDPCTGDIGGFDTTLPMYAMISFLVKITRYENDPGSLLQSTFPSSHTSYLSHKNPGRWITEARFEAQKNFIITFRNQTCGLGELHAMPDVKLQWRRNRCSKQFFSLHRPFCAISNVTLRTIA
ncbi:hypothetical protein LZ32DRAFT_56354 [Colletotrichum eremochloae]|nr:hypothetical protein LZ32DRAFT_56354 [Colletotrichum eremochloae]